MNLLTRLKNKILSEAILRAYAFTIVIILPHLLVSLTRLIDLLYLCADLAYCSKHACLA